MELKDFREQIDSLDRDLVRLFFQRMELAGQIGDYKRERTLPGRNRSWRPWKRTARPPCGASCGSYIVKSLP